MFQSLMKKKCDTYLDYLQGNMADCASEKKDILAIQLNNSKEAKKYFSLSLRNASLSFALSVFACLAGLTMLGFGAYHVIATKNTGAGIITSIGAGIAEFIAATIFWVHRKSAEQLNRYYDSLHEVEVFLSSLAVIKLISPHAQDAAYNKVLNELIRLQIIKAQSDAAKAQGGITLAGSDPSMDGKRPVKS